MNVVIWRIKFCIPSGSSFVWDFVQAGLRVPEGVWIGEQRGRANFLPLELPEGEYEVQLSAAHKLIVLGRADHCVALSTLIKVTPLENRNGVHIELYLRAFYLLKYGLNDFMISDR